MSDEVRAQIANGDPIPVSEFTLGDRYDMYRDLGIKRPPAPGIPRGDETPEWTITVGGEEK